jgi:TolB protein
MRALLAVLIASVACAACTDSNIVGTSTRHVGGTVVLFASNRSDDNFELYRVAETGDDLRRLTQDRVNNDLAPVASHDARQIAWEKEILAPGGSVTSVEIWVMNVDGSNPHVVVRNGSENRSPSWVKGDTALVFESRLPGNADIFRVSLTGGAPVNLTHNAAADQYPRVSPNGSQILFQTNRDFNFEIYVMNIDGSGVRNLSANPADDRFAAWSPDGATIVWSRFVDSFDLFLMSADGSSQRSLLSSFFEETNPSFAPDGSSIVYQTNRFPRSSLDVTPVSTVGPRALTGTATRPPTSDVAPWWTTALP